MKINTNKFNSINVVNAIVNVAKKHFDDVVVKEKDYGNFKVFWIHIKSLKYKSDFEIEVKTYFNGIYEKEAVRYLSRPYGDGSRYNQGYYGKVFRNPEDGIYYRKFTKTDGEKSITIGYSGGEKFKSNNQFYQKFHQFYHAIYCVAWETGGFATIDPYESAQEYYEWGASNGWFDQLLKEIKIWKKKIKEGILYWRDTYPMVTLVYYKGKYWHWSGKGLISLDDI